MDNYQTILNACFALDEQYRNSDNPNVGYRIGHYDEANRLVMFYAVDSDRIDHLRAELETTGVRFRIEAVTPGEDETNVLITV